MEKPDIIKIDNKGKKGNIKVKQTVRKISEVKVNKKKSIDSKTKKVKKVINKPKKNNTKKKDVNQKVSKKNYIVTFGLILSILLITTGLTVAYFTASVDGNEKASSTIIETADLRLIFTDTELLEMKEALPGQSETKIFTVENKGNVEIEYTIDIINLRNDFINGELVYTLSSDNGGANVERVPFPTEITDDTHLATATIVPGVIQTYTIEVLFLETGSDQNHNQGAILNGTLQINAKNMYTVVSGWFDDCDEQSETLSCKMILNEETISDETIDFRYNSSGTTGCLWDGSSVYDCQTDTNKVTSGLYYTSDKNVLANGEDNKRIYYYRGDVDNNWVDFAGYKWRIVRTTSEGGVKLVYSGDGLTDTSAFIAISAFNDNLAMDSKYYAGYTYNTNLSGYTGDQTDSTIKTVVDSWYEGKGDFTSLASKVSDYENYLSTTTVFCSDRSYERVDGTYTDFPGYLRVWEMQRPTFACSSSNASRYTVDESAGNGYLTNPIGLLSVDELTYAGFSDINLSTDSYIMDNISTHYWTMSPATVSEGDVSLFFVHEGGGVLGTSMVATVAVRPSVALKSCVTITGGSGSFDDTYKLSNSKC